MKTIEEAAKEYSASKSSSEIFQEQHAKDFKAGVEFAQRLIPVEEDLPEISEDMEFSTQVICKTKTEKFVLAYYDFNQKKFTCSQFGLTVTHWRQIELK